jgi:hypothetical protein
MNREIHKWGVIRPVDVNGLIRSNVVAGAEPAFFHEPSVYEE